MPTSQEVTSSFQSALDYFEVWSSRRLRAEVARVGTPVVTPPDTCEGALASGGHFRELGYRIAPDEVHVATAVFGPCWTTSAAPAGPENWFLVAGIKPNSAFPTRTVVHEFGHNLGLGHANGWSCYAQTMLQVKAPDLDSADCVEVEYGDSTSVMGSGRLDVGDDDLGASALVQLGWLRQDVHASAEPGVRSYALAPYSKTKGAGRLILPGD